MHCTRAVCAKASSSKSMGAVRDMLFCHCSMCRKAHGTAFRARGRVKTVDLRRIRGEDSVRFYESSLGEHQGFCSVCGSNLFTKFSVRSQELGLAPGVLDDDPGGRPIYHVFVGSKAPRFEITDDLPQHEAFPSTYIQPGKSTGDV